MLIVLSDPNLKRMNSPGILCIFFQLRNDTLRHSREASQISPLLYWGKRLFPFPGNTSSVAKKRAAFSTVKHQLPSCPRVKFGLGFPDTVRITVPDTANHTFEARAASIDFDLKLGSPSYYLRHLASFP